MNTIDEMIEVLNAFKEGKKLECTFFGDSEDHWSYASTPCFNFDKYQYRVKPDPFECWVNVYPSGDISGVYKTKEDALLIAESGGFNEKTVFMREPTEC